MENVAKTTRNGTGNPAKAADAAAVPDEQIKVWKVDSKVGGVKNARPEIDLPPEEPLLGNYPPKKPKTVFRSVSAGVFPHRLAWITLRHASTAHQSRSSWAASSVLHAVSNRGFSMQETFVSNIATSPIRTNNRARFLIFGPWY